MTKSLKAKPGLLKFCIVANKVGPWVYGILYGLFVLLLLPVSPMGAVRVFLVPVGSYFLVQLVSMLLVYPKPYEKFGVEPAIPEDKADGHSIPCKQAYWYTMIALVFLLVLAYPYRLIGVVLLVGAVVLSVVRIIGGLHFTRDVVIGIVLAVIFAYVGLIG